MSPTSEFSKVLALVIPCYNPVLVLVVADTFLVNISNIPTFHPLSDNSTCTAFTKVWQIGRAFVLVTIRPDANAGFL